MLLVFSSYQKCLAEIDKLERMNLQDINYIKEKQTLYPIDYFSYHKLPVLDIFNRLPAKGIRDLRFYLHMPRPRKENINDAN